MGERVFMKGCEAIAEAAVRAGCRFFAGYPITPQNEIPEYLARRMPEVGGSSYRVSPRSLRYTCFTDQLLQA